MTQYNGMYEYILKLQDAYDTPTPTIYEPKKEKWVLVPKFPPVTPKHNRTTKSFEDTKRILRELDNDPICQLTEIHQFVQHQEQGGPVLTKKLTPPKHTGNKQGGFMKSIDIAVHLLKKSIKLGQNDSNYYMDFIKLHKLMFLAQCYLNFEYNLDLFDDKITANDDGPYVDGLNSVPAICGFDIIKNIDDLMVHLHHIMPCHLAHILPLPLLRGETLDLILDVFGKCAHMKL